MWGCMVTSAEAKTIIRDGADNSAKYQALLTNLGFSLLLYCFATLEICIKLLK